MTDHPITPPQELVQQWMNEIYEKGNAVDSDHFRALAARAAQWGADQELEACCVWLESEPDPGHVDLLRSCATALRTARRPKPPSLKEQALSELMLTADPNGAELSSTQVELIQKALEALPDDL